MTETRPQKLLRKIQERPIVAMIVSLAVVVNLALAWMTNVYTNTERLWEILENYKSSQKVDLYAFELGEAIGEWALYDELPRAYDEPLPAFALASMQKRKLESKDRFELLGVNLKPEDIKFGSLAPADFCIQAMVSHIRKLISEKHGHETGKFFWMGCRSQVFLHATTYQKSGKIHIVDQSDDMMFLSAELVDEFAQKHDIKFKFNMERGLSSLLFFGTEHARFSDQVKAKFR